MENELTYLKQVIGIIPDMYNYPSGWNVVQCEISKKIINASKNSEEKNDRKFLEKKCSVCLTPWIQGLFSIKSKSKVKCKKNAKKFIIKCLVCSNQQYMDHGRKHKLVNWKKEYKIGKNNVTKERKKCKLPIMNQKKKVESVKKQKKNDTPLRKIIKEKKPSKLKFLEDLL